MENEKQNNSVGSMWSNRAANEKKTPYKSIIIDLDALREKGFDFNSKELRLTAFINFYKEENSKQPDYKLVLKENITYERAKAVAKKAEKVERNVKAMINEVEKEMEERYNDNEDNKVDEIPF